MKDPIQIVVTGAGGQLAKAIEKVAGNDFDIIFLDKNALDITDKNSIEKAFQQYNPQVVINTAAYTQVDASETHRELAFKINAEGVLSLAEFCLGTKCKLIHVSTDYVFEGDNKIPYLETDIPNPVTVYGKSKREGEQNIMDLKLPVFAIVRTSWLYSGFGNNFYNTMLRLSYTKKEIKVVNDQLGSPTFAPHLASTLLKIAGELDSSTSGIYHYCNSGITTWYGFAREIFKKNNLSVTLHPITTEEYPTPAKRPSYSVLNTKKIQEVFSIKIPEWQAGIEILKNDLP